MDEREQRDYPPFHERDDNIGVADHFELITKFSMEQNLGHYGYDDKLNHLNKNLLFTNLSREWNEPEIIQNFSKSLTILANHTERKQVLVPTGEIRQVETEQGIVEHEVFEKQYADVRRFKRLEIYMASKVFSITSTAAGTNAALLEKLKSTFLHKEQTIEDKTKTESGMWAKLKGKR